ncbi:hypothetical protein ANCCAN_26189 [Ancylostoma caninum]|uniref:ABC transporter domain-containing protein n=1 Tax=Ancylostoma caninum TaxID=29170 RepID=A0A368F7J6_ANCCA|nr:hypothetical protein ANCCAN_26189 [Ancylostoma caninum]
MDIEATVPMIGKSAKARRRPVLRKVSGVALPREVLAIMGSSGAGKTTLMNILAFQSSKEVESNGAVLVNGKAMTKYEMRRMSAYVQQIDLFCGTLTVKEQLMYSALLRMGNKYSHREKMEKVEEAIKDMNLYECQDSIIGVPNRRKGISVGEKKRLAFASEVCQLAVRGSPTFFLPLCIFYTCKSMDFLLGFMNHQASAGRTHSISLTFVSGALKS